MRAGLPRIYRAVARSAASLLIRSSMPVAAGRLAPRAMACRQALSRSATALVMASTGARCSFGTTTRPLASPRITSPGRTVTPPHCTTTLIAPGPWFDPVVTAEVGESLPGDVADHRRVGSAAAVDDQHVAGGDQVRRLQHVQDVAGFGPHGHRRAAYLRAACQVTQRRAHDRDRTTAVGDLRRGELPQRGHQLLVRPFGHLANRPLIGMGLAHMSARVQTTASGTRPRASDLGRRQSRAGRLGIRYASECTPSSITPSITAGRAGMTASPLDAHDGSLSALRAGDRVAEARAGELLHRDGPGPAGGRGCRA